ncbi:MAG TPA: GNAT family N-acetyltransferase [Petrotogaceae bacterium]|nr:GNAT family N-acetyltransferase [Petrotogaceae bacterium]
MNDFIKIRGANEHDMDRILEIQSKCFRQGYLESRDSLFSKILSSGDTCILAIAGTEIAGYFFSVEADFYEPPVFNSTQHILNSTPDCLYLHDLSVDPKFRGMGIGSILLERLHEKAKEKSLNKLSLIAIDGLVPYWSKNGFSVVTVIPQKLSDCLQSYGKSCTYMLRII